MSTTLHPATPDMTRDEAAELLEKHKIHHAVVVSLEGFFAGLFSSWDIARECALDAKVRTKEFSIHQPCPSDNPTTPSYPITSDSTSIIVVSVPPPCKIRGRSLSYAIYPCVNFAGGADMSVMSTWNHTRRSTRLGPEDKEILDTRAGVPRTHAANAHPVECYF